MTYMGSYISIGLTYEIDKFENLVYDYPTLDKVKQELENLIEYFMSYNGFIKEIKYSEDLEGESWIKINSPSFFSSGDYYDNFCKGYFGEIIIHSSILKGENLDCTIRFHKKSNFFGFLMDLQEEDLLKSEVYSKEEIDHMTKELIAIMISLYSYSKYDYAFCDHEAEFNYSPEIFKNLDEYVYSISVIPNSIGSLFTIIKSDWNIDGHTTREKHGKETITHFQKR